MMVVFFDLDGTLTESAPGITRSIAEALRKMGCAPLEREQLEAFVGPPLSESFAPIFQGSRTKIQQAISYFRERYETIGKFENSLYPGVDTMLRKLKETGILLGIASSKPEKFVREILAHFHVLSFFSIIQGASMDEKLVEKDAILSLALSELRHIKEQEMHVYMVGDRKYDMEAASGLNIIPVGVSYGYGSEKELKEAGAARIFDSVDALQAFLLEEAENVS